MATETERAWARWRSDGQQQLACVPNERERELAASIERVRADVADVLGYAREALDRGELLEALRWIAYAQLNRRHWLNLQRRLDNPRRDVRNPRYRAEVA